MGEPSFPRRNRERFAQAGSCPHAASNDRVRSVPGVQARWKRFRRAVAERFDTAPLHASQYLLANARFGAEGFPGGRMSGLERVVTGEELEYASRQITIASRRGRIAELQEELSELSAALNEFERQYRARIGGLQTEIERMRKEITDYRDRITLLKARIANREANIPDPPPFDDDHDGPDPDFERQISQKRRPPIDPETAEALRTVYRQLAKRFHPDLATSPEERHRREEMMLRINEAFEERNLAALESIARETERDDPAFGFRPAVERLAWATLEISRLDGTITGLESQISTLRSSRTYEYWRATELIDDVIERLAEEARDKSELLSEKLTELVVAHDKLRARLDARQRFRQIAERRLRAS